MFWCFILHVTTVLISLKCHKTNHGVYVVWYSNQTQ